MRAVSVPSNKTHCDLNCFSNFKVDVIDTFVEERPFVEVGGQKF